MSRNHKDSDNPATALKDEFARQRWELFHRAIAYAKQSNCEALVDTDSSTTDAGPAGPQLSIVR